MNDKERINNLCNYLGVTIYSISKELGFKRPDVFYKIDKERNGISKDLAKKIVEKYPQISYGWLLTGSGSMLSEENKLDKVIQMDFPDLEKLDAENKLIDAEMALVQEKREKYISKKELSESEKFIILSDNLSIIVKSNAKLIENNEKVVEGNLKLIETNSELARSIIEITKNYLSTNQ